MLSAWAKAVVAFGLCLSLVAAPCKNCQPKEQKQDHCGHDCCPKPKPASQPCSWQPADFDAIEQGKSTAVPSPVLTEAPDTLPATFILTIAPQDPHPALDPSPPPYSPSTSVLRI